MGALDNLQAALAKVQSEQASTSTSTSTNTSNTAEWARFAGAGHDTREDPGTKTIQSDYSRALDAALTGLDIVSAYRRYTPKMVPNPGSKRESVMISCPKPDHPDKRPSAWMNLDKGTWFCGGCQVGGDILDLAAIGLNMYPHYKETSNFPEFMEALGESLGVRKSDFLTEPEPVTQGAWSEHISPEPEPAPEPEPEPAPEPAPVPEPEPAPVPVSVSKSARTDIGASPMPFDTRDALVPRLDWRSIVTPGTFLEAYMRQGIKDDAPEEFHFWHAMMALSVVAGNNVLLDDIPKVHANLFVCILGPTGSGKSKAARNMHSILGADTIKRSEYNTSGIQLAHTPNSEIALIDEFMQPEHDDPTQPKKITGYSSVRGIVQFNEMKSLMDSVTRASSRLDAYLIDFFDCRDVITSNARTTGALVAQNAHCSVLSTTQPDSLKEFLSEKYETSGFLNRWLFVGGPRKVAPSVINRVTVDMTEALALFNVIYIWCKYERTVIFSQEAEELFQSAMLEYIKKDIDKYQASFARMDLYLKKLALILALNEMSLVVTREHMLKVLSIYPYLKAFVESRADAMNYTIASELDEWIVEFIHANQKAYTGRQILRSLPKRFGANADKINKVLDSLVKSGAITKEKEMRRPGQRGVLKEYYMTHELAQIEVAAGNIQPRDTGVTPA